MPRLGKVRVQAVVPLAVNDTASGTARSPVLGFIFLPLLMAGIIIALLVLLVLVLVRTRQRRRQWRERRGRERALVRDYRAGRLSPSRPA